MWDIMPLRRRRMGSFQRLYRTKSYPTGKMKHFKKEPPGEEEEGEWRLVSCQGDQHKLPKTMIFLGREECDIEVQTGGVDKRHAVVTFDHYLRRFKIKDLSTSHGTHVNGTRIPEQEYFILEQDDHLRLGHDHSLVFKMERCEPEVQVDQEPEIIFNQNPEDSFHQTSAFDTSPPTVTASTSNLTSNHDKDLDLPSWASQGHQGSQDVESPMAECQGCIVEQRIEHTCGEDSKESFTAHRDLDRSYSHDNIPSFSLGGNTWPKKRLRPGKKSVKEIFPSDDMDDRQRYTVDSLLVDMPPSRVLRGTGAAMNILPDELSTVKKGTPLYGQPEWWGEEETDLNMERLRGNGMEADSRDMDTSSDPTMSSASGQPSQNGVTSSNNNVPNNDPSVPTATSSNGKKATTPEGITNMAFTIDFSEESKGLEGRSLGDMMPPKLRKSLRDRKEKHSDKDKEKESSAASKSSSSKEKVTPEKPKNSPDKGEKPKHRSVIEKMASSVLGTGRATSEGRDISPTRQQKIEDLWNSGASSGHSSESAATKRLRLASKSSSNKSIEEDGQVSSPGTKGPKSSVLKRQGSGATPLSKPKSVIRARKAVSQEILASTQFSTPSNNGSSFLIDKMFQNNSTGSVDSLRTKGTESSVTEYDLYHESVKYDTDQAKLSQSINITNNYKPKTDSKEKLNKTGGKSDTKKVRSKEIIPAAILKKSEDDAEKVPDKVSESGTYTIEEEKDSKEEDEARKNIDKVFGVDQSHLVEPDYSTGDNLSDDLKQQLRNPAADKQGKITANIRSLDLELEELDRLEKRRTGQPMIDSLEAELGSAGPISDEYDEENPTVPSDAPQWVSQWAALTNQKPQHKSDMDLSSPGSSISDEGRSSGKSHGLSRKRPGTGRRLPTIPPGATSPAMSDRSNRSATKESPRTSKCDLTINGTSPAVQSNARSVKISSHVSAKYNDTDSESISLTKYGSDLDTVRDVTERDSSSRGRGSNSSIASLDTDVLLKDTETVMTAMEKRMGSKTRPGHSSKHEKENKSFNSLAMDNGYSKSNGSYSQTICPKESVGDCLILDDSMDFESDASSCVALVNGDEDFVKPSMYKSPRDVLGGKGKLKIADSLPSKPSVKMSGAKSKTESDRHRKKSVEEKSYVSDVLSDITLDTTRTDDLDNTDAGKFNRQGSKGKGQMSMTRPNRAFALRRALADGDESSTTIDTARSSSSIASSGLKTSRGSGSLGNLAKTSSSGSTPQKPRRPMSGVLSDRNPPDSNRSQASLGAQIVKKSRDNLNTSLTRTDGGRHSLRVTRSMSIPTKQQEVQPQPSSASKHRRTDSGSNIHHTKSLRVTGVSARERSSSMNRHAQRSTNSPKSAERNAWQRRKQYDPRKAVAEAKTKTKPDSSKHRSDDVFNKHRGVTRSASFTNARDLKLSSYKCDSTSSTEEYSRRSSEASDVFEDSMRRSFVPYSTRSALSSKVSNGSVEEDELDKSARSSSAQSSSQVTPNLQHTDHHVSPQKSPDSNNQLNLSQNSEFSAFNPPRQPLPLSVYKPTPRLYRSTTSSRAKIRLKTPSPTPATSITMLKERRSVDSLKLYNSVITANKNSPEKASPRVHESYDTLIVSSIYQLSLKLKSQTDRTMEKLQDTEVIENGLDSPLDELENQSAISEIPAYKSANQELAGVLKNLRKLEQHIKVINKVLFPDDVSSPDMSKEKHEYMQEIERIKNELAGFQPIDTPRDDAETVETASIESDCEELSGHADYY